MAEIRVTPANVQSVLDRVGPGDTVVLTAGSYGAILRLAGRAGHADRPIVLRGEPGAVLDGGRSAEDFREQGNHMALATWRGEAPGTKPHDYPGLWPWLLDGRLVLERCRHVRLEGLALERGWPTLIALDRCREIVVSNCEFRDGTFAIGAEGRDSYGITIEDCHWVQDRVPNRMWQQIPWARIHGHPNDDEPVDLEHDWRLFDGDFFRAEGIRGGVTIRNCSITAAFNAIHLFNDRADAALSHDVQVHDCVFCQIRDNVFEPEKTAFNWWFYRNEIVNCHKWFSIECQQSGYFYLFANRGWFDSIQGPVGDDYRGGGVFKLGKHVSPARGRHYVLHNSFSVRSDHIRKGVLPRWEHFGNAIRFAQSGDPVYDGPAEVFGDLSADPSDLDGRFTTRWREFDIAMVTTSCGMPTGPIACAGQATPWGRPLALTRCSAIPSQASFDSSAIARAEARAARRRSSSLTARHGRYRAVPTSAPGKAIGCSTGLPSGHWKCLWAEMGRPTLGQRCAASAR